jgi:hypothetical protein
MARKQAKPAENGDGVATADPGTEIVWKGNELLRPFLVPIKNLREDDRNARAHPDASIEAIGASYLRFGQGKPIVVAKDGTVKDGNGQLVAAVGLGWTHIAVIPSDLEGHELVAYALAVNRSGELSEWNFEELARQLKELEGYGAETADMGWDPAELESLMAIGRSSDTRNGRVNPAATDGSPGPVQFREYDESVVDEVKFLECPECHHKWPA